MGNRDFRIEPPQLTPREQLRHYRSVVGRHLITIGGLWPTPGDYRGLRKSWTKDLIAGITVGVVALPLALGFGVASGVGAGVGLVTAIVAGIVAAIFGGSHLQVSGPTGAMTVVLLPVIAKHGIEMVPLLAIMGGVMVVAMALLAIGRTVDFVPVSVIQGFTMGIGTIIALQQIPLVSGTERVGAESTLVSSWLTLQATDWAKAWQPIALTVFVVVLHLVGQKYFKKLPISLISIIIATVLVETLPTGVARIGSLPSALPRPVLPPLSLGIIEELAAPALAVATLAALESLLSARVADGMRPDLEPTNPDRELMGQGLANIASGLFGGLPATGAIARTAVNVRSGARTRLSSVTHAVSLLAVMIFLAPLVSRVPMAALGGVLLVTAGRMVSVSTLVALSRVTRADRNTFWITFLATVVLDLVAAVLLGLLMAAVMSLRHMAAYTVVARQSLPSDTREGVVDFSPEQEHLRSRMAMYRVDGALFYGNAQRFVEELSGVESGIDAVILRCHRLRILDASGADALQTVARRFKRRGIALVVQGMNRSQRRTCRLMKSVRDDQQVTELSEAIDWVDRVLTGRVETS